MSAPNHDRRSLGSGAMLIVPDRHDYDDARAIWNGTVDRRPRLIARCRGTADVAAAVRFARRPRSRDRRSRWRSQRGRYRSMRQRDRDRPPADLDTVSVDPAPRPTLTVVRRSYLGAGRRRPAGPVRAGHHGRAKISHHRGWRA